MTKGLAFVSYPSSFCLYRLILSPGGTDVLNKFWKGWLAFGRFLGNFLARIVLTIFYFTIFVPFGLGVRWFSDPLKIKTNPDTLWRPRTTSDQTLEDTLRQF